MVSANKINLITGQFISITSFFNFFVSYMHVIFWLFWLLKIQDVFFQKLKAFQVQICNFYCWPLHSTPYPKICWQYMNHCNLCPSSMNFCFLTFVIKQEGAKWAKWNCWAHMLMGFILILGKVRKHWTMSMEANRMIFLKVQWSKF